MLSSSLMCLLADLRSLLAMIEASVPLYLGFSMGRLYEGMNNKKRGSLGTIWKVGYQLLQGYRVALTPGWDSSILTLSTFGARTFFVVGTILCAVECVAAAPVSAHQMAVVLPTVTLKRSTDIGNVLWGRSQTTHSFPWRTTAPGHVSYS